MRRTSRKQHSATQIFVTPLNRSVFEQPQRNRPIAKILHLNILPSTALECFCPAVHTIQTCTFFYTISTSTTLHLASSQLLQCLFSRLVACACRNIRETRSLRRNDLRKIRRLAVNLTGGVCEQEKIIHPQLLLSDGGN